MDVKAEATPAKRQGRLFYGWAVAGIGFLCSLVTAGVGTYAFSVLYLPLAQEMGTSRAALAGVITVRGIVGGLAGPLIGPLVDRRNGARLLVSLGGVLAGAGLVGVGLAEGLLQFYLAFGLVWGIAAATFGEVVTYTTVSKWFVRRRGQAMALATAGISVGGIVFTPIAQSMLSGLGLKATWIVLGVLTWLLIVPLAAVFMRRSPEDLGLAPDGYTRPSAAATHESSAAIPPAQEEAWTLREALRTPSLWLIVVASNLGWLGLTAMLTHQVPYLRDKGVSSGAAAWVLWTYAIAALAAKPMWGLMADRFHVRRCVIVAYALSGMGYGLLTLTVRLEWLFPWVIFQGLANGGFMLLTTLVWANYYGRTFQGTIRGVVAPLNLVSYAGGPLMAAYIYDVTRSYNLAFVILCGLSLLASVFMVLARPPVRKRAALPGLRGAQP